MNEPHETLGERLLNAERMSPAYREEYEKEVRKMVEKKLTGPLKCVYLATAALTAGLAAVFGTVAVISWGKLPALATVAFAIGVPFGLAWTAIALWVVRRGRFDVRSHGGMMTGMSWGFVVVLVTLFMLLGAQLPDPVIGVQMVVNGIVFLVMAAVGLLMYHIQRAQMRTHEKLLEIEYRLAELAEEVKKDSGD